MSDRLEEITAKYLPPLDVAMQIALEKIEEWDYERDPHGYCHDRTTLIALREGVLSARARIAQLEEGLRAYDALFRAWEGRDSLTLNEEAIRQWRSIAAAALSSPETPE